MTGTLTIVLKENSLSGTWTGSKGEPWPFTGELRVDRFELTTSVRESPVILDGQRTTARFLWRFRGENVHDTLRGTMDWGRSPVDPERPGPNEFWSVHSIGISRDRRLFVADREHHRMQVFDENGKFLAMWPTGYNSSVLAHFVTQDDFVWVADWTTNRLVKYDLDGHYILDIGGGGALPGQFDGVHQIHVDSARNLYVTEVSNDRSQMFRPKPNADPNRIVGQMAIVNPKP